MTEVQAGKASEKPLKEVACVVCGMKSTRADWQDNPSPKCDSHKDAPKPAPGSAQTLKGKTTEIPKAETKPPLSTAPVPAPEQKAAVVPTTEPQKS